MSDALCPRIGKLIGGCKFSPRYDRTPPTASQLQAASMLLIGLVESLTTHRYIADVCERCGKTLVRRKTGQGA